MVIITFKNNTYADVKYYLPSSDKGIMGLLRKYSKEKGFNFNFYFKNQKIKAFDTPASLGYRQGDFIEARTVECILYIQLLTGDEIFSSINPDAEMSPVISKFKDSGLDLYYKEKKINSNDTPRSIGCTAISVITVKPVY